MIQVKICGINDPAAMDAVVAAGADYAGFVFFPPSPRAVTPEQAAALSGRARILNGPQPVALLVDPTDDAIAAVLLAIPHAILQVHADSARAADIQLRFGVPVWHAVGIGGAEDLPAEAPGITRLLLDHKAPPDAALPGGNARAFDWSLLRGWSPPVPWLLAGGLTPETVASAITATGATAVDVSSGVERARGIKDPALIASFVAAAKHPA